MQPSYAIVDIDGAQGILPIDEISWHLLEDCTGAIGIGEELEVELLAVKVDEHELVVSRRKCLEDPFSGVSPQELLGSRDTLVVTSRGGTMPGRRFVAGSLRDKPRIPARLYETELEWGGGLYGVNHLNDGMEIPVVLYELQNNARFAFCSRKRLTANKWDEIRRKYASGQSLQVLVTAIRDEGVWCEVEPGLTGFVSSDEFRRAGHEYLDFQSNIRIGQQLFVVITRIVAGQKQRLNLGLQINRTTS